MLQNIRSRGIRQELLRMFALPALAAALIIVMLFLMLVNTGRQYEAVLQNANTAADFNKEFKKTIDSEMYNHVIRPRAENDEQTLPLAELDNAVEVLEKLSLTTALPDNRWRIRSMLSMCENLREYMCQIAHTPSYDRRMELLERNIRGETGLTALIETYMHEYMDDEVREMARLQADLKSKTAAALWIVAALTALFTVALIFFTAHVSRKIARPIRALSEKAAAFGRGTFAAEPVTTGIAELQTLDRGFDDMAGRISSLMESQISDQHALHRAELELLQAQINPHFLYNTLDSIAILAENDREEDAVLMVNSLSAFFRISLSKGKDIIPLRDEINHVKSYLQIQHIRYSDILNYEIDIDPGLEDALVPKLILQPLVENALYHGIKNRRGVGTIRITGRHEGDDLVLKVRDNGAGMDSEQLRALQAGVYEDRHTGLGLVNVHKRVRLYCGEGYGLSFESKKDEGTTVTVRLPGRLRAEEP